MTDPAHITEAENVVARVVEETTSAFIPLSERYRIARPVVKALNDAHLLTQDPRATFHNWRDVKGRTEEQQRAERAEADLERCRALAGLLADEVARLRAEPPSEVSEVIDALTARRELRSLRQRVEAAVEQEGYTCIHAFVQPDCASCGASRLRRAVNDALKQGKEPPPAKVYLAFEDLGYEGKDLVGVNATLEGAIHAASQDAKRPLTFTPESEGWPIETASGDYFINLTTLND